MSSSNIFGFLSAFLTRLFTTNGMVLYAFATSFWSSLPIRTLCTISIFVFSEIGPRFFCLRLYPAGVISLYSLPVIFPGIFTLVELRYLIFFTASSISFGSTRFSLPSVLAASSAESRNNFHLFDTFTPIYFSFSSAIINFSRVISLFSL